MSINYIIATYSGKYRKYENKEDVLQKQLEFLVNIIQKQNSPLIKQVTIVCPVPKHKEIFKEYYQKEKWIEIFNKLPVNLVYLEYKGNNIDHSYDQWIQGYMAYPDYEYNILMEDDYCIHPDNITFDIDLINMYKEKFPENIGYLTTWTSNNNNHSLHAAISNGMISSKTFRKFNNPLETYYNMKKIEKYPQLKFSYMFTNNGIKIDDIGDKYKILFWNSDTAQILDFSKSSTNNLLLVPIQYLGIQTNVTI